MEEEPTHRRIPHDSNHGFAQMAENSSGVVVTEVTLIEAVRAGDLGRLTIWATQGVRVTTGIPILHAVGCGQLEVVRLLVQDWAPTSVKPLPE
jgi:hypothetical protein